LFAQPAAFEGPTNDAFGLPFSVTVTGVDQVYASIDRTLQDLLRLVLGGGVGEVCRT
jgi:hypothetical protein